jgi:unspecific monooxygenase
MLSMSAMRDAPTAPERVIPPVPEPLPEGLSTRALIRAYATNVLATYPQRAFEDDVAVRPFYGRLSFLINAPEDIRRVLVDNDAAYGRTRATTRIIHPLLGEGLFLSHGESWRRQRRATAPAFAPKAVPAFARATARALAEAHARLALDGDATMVDLLAWLQHLALDVASRALFSMPIGPFGRRLRQRIVDYGLRHSRGGFLDFFLPTSVPSPRDLGRRWFQWRWMRDVDQLVTARMASVSARDAPDLFELLRGHRDPVSGDRFSERELRDQVATLIVAGHATTALALFWGFYLLALSPGWQERVAKEAAAHDLGPEGAADALPSLVIARAVVQEALRLYPPAFIIVRQALAADRLAGRDVPPGTVVMIAPWVLHRHRRRWECPEVFDPTRFLPGSPTPGRFAFLPFGAGPRVCVGAPLAMTEATLVLAEVARRYRIALADDSPVLPVGIVTTQPSRPVLFRLDPR